MRNVTKSEDSRNPMGGRIPSGPGVKALNRWNSHYKYNKEDTIPVVKASPEGSYRFFPALDGAGQSLPYVQDGELTWVATERGIDYFGIRIPDTPLKDSYSMWLVPKDVEQYWPTELAAIVDPTERANFVVKHCPYSYIYHRLKSATGDANCPKDWGSLGDKEQWKKLTGGRSTYSPLSPVNVTAVVQCAIFKNDGVEQKDPAGNWTPVFPAAVEFTPSASRAFMEDGIFYQQVAHTPTDNPSDRFTYKNSVSPDQGILVSLSKIAKTQQGSATPYFVHIIRPEGSTLAIPLETLQQHWMPFRDPMTVVGRSRAPLLTFLTCEQQVSILLLAFQREIVDYCLRETPYWNLLPQVAKNSWDAYMSKYGNTGNGHWLQYIQERERMDQGSVEFAPPQMSKPMTFNAGPTKEEIQQTLAQRQATPAQVFQPKPTSPFTTQPQPAAMPANIFGNKPSNAIPDASKTPSIGGVDPAAVDDFRKKVASLKEEFPEEPEGDEEAPF